MGMDPNIMTPHPKDWPPQELTLFSNPHPKGIFSMEYLNELPVWVVGDQELKHPVPFTGDEKSLRDKIKFLRLNVSQARPAKTMCSFHYPLVFRVIMRSQQKKVF